MAACLFGVVAATSIAPFAGCSRAEQRSVAEDLIYTSPDDAKVNAATAEARKTLPIFWAKFDAEPAGYDAFSLKVGLPTADNGVEHIWVDHLKRDGDEIEGLIANDPVALKGLHLDSKVKVAVARVSDWQYRKNGKLYGHFTTRALWDHANAAQRAEAAELFAPTPLEPEAN